MNLPAHQAGAVALDVEDRGAASWFPGPLVRRLLLVAVMAIALSGGLAAWWVSHTISAEAMDRLESQQNDEVELVARLLASKIDQSQKVLATVADGITPEILGRGTQIRGRRTCAREGDVSTQDDGEQSAPDRSSQKKAR